MRKKQKYYQASRLIQLALAATPLSAAPIYVEDFEDVGVTGTARTFGSGWAGTDWVTISGPFMDFRANILGGGLVDPAISGAVNNTFANVREAVAIALDVPTSPTDATPVLYQDNATYTFSLDRVRQSLPMGGQDNTEGLNAVEATVSFRTVSGTVLATQIFAAHTPFDSVSNESISYTTAGGPEVGEPIRIVIESTNPDVDGRFAVDNLLLDVTLENTGVAPLLSPTTPADDTVGVLVSTDLTAEFDKPVQLTGAGSITIVNLAGGERVIDLADPSAEAELVLTPTAAGTILTLDLNENLEAGSDFAVLISSDAFEDFETPANPFAGISDDTTWNFSTTADGDAPVLTLISPADDEVDVDQAANLVATFNEDIVANAGSIGIFNLSNGTNLMLPIDDPQVTIAGSTLTVDLTDLLLAGNQYGISLPQDLVADTTGNLFEGNDLEFWTFTTLADTTPPSLTLPTFPSFGGTDHNQGFILMIFDELTQAPAADAASPTNITIRNLTTGVDQVFDARNPAEVGFGNGFVSVSFELAPGANYAVMIDPGSVLDLSGNPFAGITDFTTWTFTSAETVENTLYTENFDGLGISGGQRTFGLGWRDTAWVESGDSFPEFRANIRGVDFVNAAVQPTVNVAFADVREAVAVTLDLPDVFVSNATYTFSFDQIRETNPDLNAVEALVSIQDANGTVLASEEFSALTDFDTVLSRSLSYTTEAGSEIGQTIRIVIESINPDVDGRFSLDNVMLTELLSTNSGGNNFSNWIIQFPGVGSENGLTDDPDGDGVENGVENFFGTAPDVFTQGLVAGTLSNDDFTFTHPQGELADDLSFVYRWSKDLDTFLDQGQTDDEGTTVSFVRQLNTPVLGMTTVTASVSGTATEKLFFQVFVTQE